MAWLGRRRWSSHGAATLLVAVVLAAGCTDTRAPAASGNPGSSADPAPAAAGAIQVALQVPPNVQISTVAYQVTHGSFSQSGTIDASHSGTITGVIGGLPPGTGYQLTLTASDPSHQLTGCAGTATFDVTAGIVTSVPIDITCHVTPPATPAVPIPFPAVALLAAALLGAGLSLAGRARRGDR